MVYVKIDSEENYVLSVQREKISSLLFFRVGYEWRIKVKNVFAKTAAAAVLAVSCMCTQTLAVTLDAVDYDKETGGILISGTAQSGGTVLLHIVRDGEADIDTADNDTIENATVRLETAAADEDKAFAFSFNVRELTDTEGSFTVRVSAGKEGVEAAALTLCPPAVMAEKLKAAKQITDTGEMEEFIKENYKYFITGADMLKLFNGCILNDGGTYNSENLTETAALLLSMRGESAYCSGGARLEQDLIKAALICGINGARADIGTLLDENRGMLNLGDINKEAYAWFSEQTESIKSAVMHGTASGAGLAAADDFYKEWEWQTLKENMGAVYGADGREQVLRKYADRLSFTVFEKSGNDRSAAVGKIADGIKAGTVKDFDGVQRILDTYTSTSGSGGGNSGGGGGSGGGGSSGSGGGYAGYQPSSGVPVDTNDIKPQAQISVFTDMGDAEWAAESVNRLAEIGIINGISENKFGPMLDVTRAEFAKILCGCFGIMPDGGASSFSDVPQSEWYAEYVAALEVRGIIKGRGDNTFGPNDNITRQDMTVMIYGAGKDIFKTAEENLSRFTDAAEISDYARISVTALAELGFIEGADNMFMPLKNATRAEAAKVMDGVERYVKNHL